MHVKIRNVHAGKGRNGKIYWYHRPTGARLPDDPASPEFLARVAELNVDKNAAPRRARNAAAPLVKSGLIYVLQAGHRGPVKIGYSGNPRSFRSRVDSIQVGCSERLTVLAIAPGTMADEKAAHARFAAHRLNGEWFVFEGDVISYTMELLRVGVMNRVALVVPNV